MIFNVMYLTVQLVFCYFWSNVRLMFDSSVNMNCVNKDVFYLKGVFVGNILISLHKIPNSKGRHEILIDFFMVTSVEKRSSRVHNSSFWSLIVISAFLGPFTGNISKCVNFDKDMWKALQCKEAAGRKNEVIVKSTCLVVCHSIASHHLHFDIQKYLIRLCPLLPQIAYWCTFSVLFIYTLQLLDLKLRAKRQN